MCIGPSSDSFSKSQRNDTRKCRYGRKQNIEEDTIKQPQEVSANHYKQLLKERYCDKQRLSAPQYTTESTSGGFMSTVNVPQYKPIRGPVGNNKKEAEQFAAMEALKQLKII